MGVRGDESGGRSRRWKRWNRRKSFCCQRDTAALKHNRVSVIADLPYFPDAKGPEYGILVYFSCILDIKDLCSSEMDIRWSEERPEQNGRVKKGRKTCLPLSEKVLYGPTLYQDHMSTAN